MYKFSEKSLGKLSGCHEDLQIIFRRAIKKSPFDFAITQGHRTPEEQNELYQKGRTKPGDIVTYKDGFDKKSKHNLFPSQAVDIVIYNKEGITWKPEYYRLVADHIIYIGNQLIEKAIIEHEIFWGGDWRNFQDYPHFQI